MLKVAPCTVGRTMSSPNFYHYLRCELCHNLKVVGIVVKILARGLLKCPIGLWPLISIPAGDNNSSKRPNILTKMYKQEIIRVIGLVELLIIQIYQYSAFKSLFTWLINNLRINSIRR